MIFSENRCTLFRIMRQPANAERSRGDHAGNQRDEAMIDSIQFDRIKS